MGKLKKNLVTALEKIPGLEDRPSKVSGGSAIHKHRSPSSEWIEIRFKNEKDVKEVVRLFKLALQQY